jgi:hypothetical protein
MSAMTISSNRINMISYGIIIPRAKQEISC